jgi:DNA-directed RNA polymerase subunit RPC12/RpoP
MEIIFYCSKCSQEFAVDETAAGEQIQCPTCSEFLIIPQESVAKPQMAGAGGADGEPEESGGGQGRHFEVPLHDGRSDSLVEGEAESGAVKKIRTHCIKHYSCVEAGHDKYDDVVTEFLQRVGEENIVSINQINYDVVDSIGRTLSDYGVMVVYRG